MEWYGIIQVGVKDKYPVTFDSSQDTIFKIYKPDGSIKYFTESTSRLYFHDTLALDHITGTTLINMVEENISEYSQADYARAVLARKMQ